MGLQLLLLLTISFPGFLGPPSLVMDGFAAEPLSRKASLIVSSNTLYSKILLEVSVNRPKNF